jgi:hypothetical protein
MARKASLGRRLQLLRGTECYTMRCPVQTGRGDAAGDPRSASGRATLRAPSVRL